jgi:hypothetical protein
MNRQGLCIALAAAVLLAAGAAPAAADGTVGNPGSVSASFAGEVSLGSGTLGLFDDDVPLQLGGSVDSGGALTGGWTNTWDTSNVLSPPDAGRGPSGGISWGLSKQVLTMHSGSLTGTIDPATGAASLELPVYGTLTAHLEYSVLGQSASADMSCTEGSADSPVTIPLSTTGSVNPPFGGTVIGVPYNPDDGTLTMVSGAFTSSDPQCSGAGSFSDLSDVIGMIKTELIGSSGAGTAWMQGAFTPAITAPLPPPPPAPPSPPTGGDGGSGTGQPPAGGGQPPTPAAVKCVVPKLAKLSLSGARKKLSAASCKLGKVSHAHSKKVRKGRVLSQRTKPGTSLAGGSAIRLTLSSGAPPKKHPRHKHH